MTNWHPELAVVAPGTAHLYLVPDNGSLSRVWTVEWDPASPHTVVPGLGDRDTRTAMGLKQLFQQVGVPAPADLPDLVASLWTRLDRRPQPRPAL